MPSAKTAATPGRSHPVGREPCGAEETSAAVLSIFLDGAIGSRVTSAPA